MTAARILRAVCDKKSWYYNEKRALNNAAKVG
jgi:hypothetical protein